MGEGSVYRRQSDGRWVVEFLDLQGRTRYRYRGRKGNRLQTKGQARAALRAELATQPTANGKPRAASTIAQVRTVLGNCLHVPERYGHVTRNAARLARPVAYQHTEVEPLTLDEARALLQQAQHHRLGSMFTVALSLGLRQGECVGLHREDAANAIDRSVPVNLAVNDEAPDRNQGATRVGRAGIEPATSCVSSVRTGPSGGAFPGTVTR